MTQRNTMACMHSRSDGENGKGRPAMMTLDQRDHLLRSQGEVRRFLEALRSDEFCRGDETPLILEDGLNRELDEIGDALAEDCPGELGNEA